MEHLIVSNILTPQTPQIMNQTSDDTANTLHELKVDIKKSVKVVQVVQDVLLLCQIPLYKVCKEPLN